MLRPPSFATAAAGHALILDGFAVKVVLRLDNAAQVNPAVDAGVGMILYRALLCPLDRGSDDVFAAHKRLARIPIGACVPKVLTAAGFIGKVYAVEAARLTRYGPGIAVQPVDAPALAVVQQQSARCAFPDQPPQTILRGFRLRLLR